MWNKPLPAEMRDIDQEKVMDMLERRCSGCGAAPCINPSFCAACCLAVQQGPAAGTPGQAPADAAANRSANSLRRLRLATQRGGTYDD